MSVSVDSPLLNLKTIKFKNYRKKLAVPFRIYADFDCDVKKVKRSDKSSDRGDNASCTEKWQSHIPCSFSYKRVSIDDKFSKQLLFTEEKMQFTNLLKLLQKSDNKAF